MEICNYFRPAISKENANFSGGWDENNYPSVESSQHRSSGVQRTETLDTIEKRSSPLKVWRPFIVIVFNFFSI